MDLSLYPAYEVFDAVDFTNYDNIKLNIAASAGASIKFAFITDGKVYSIVNNALNYLCDETAITDAGNWNTLAEIQALYSGYLPFVNKSVKMAVTVISGTLTSATWEAGKYTYETDAQTLTSQIKVTSPVVEATTTNGGTYTVFAKTKVANTWGEYAAFNSVVGQTIQSIQYKVTCTSGVNVTKLAVMGYVV